MGSTNQMHKERMENNMLDRDISERCDAVSKRGDITSMNINDTYSHL